MGNTKDFNKYLKLLLKDGDFTCKQGKGNTIKIVHKSGKLYSTHPADQAINPVKSWVKNIKITKK